MCNFSNFACFSRNGGTDYPNSSKHNSEDISLEGFPASNSQPKPHGKMGRIKQQASEKLQRNHFANNIFNRATGRTKQHQILVIDRCNCCRAISQN